MKIYSGKCLQGECGTPTDMFDDYCDYIEDEHGDFKPVPNLFVGDQVVVTSIDIKYHTASYHHGICVVVDGSFSEEKPFIMGLKSIDFTKCTGERENWCIKKVKDWRDCVEGEIVPNCANITYKNE